MAKTKTRLGSPAVPVSNRFRALVRHSRVGLVRKFVEDLARGAAVTFVLKDAVQLFKETVAEKEWVSCPITLWQTIMCRVAIFPATEIDD
jgi:hypothetical protein